MIDSVNALQIAANFLQFASNIPTWFRICRAYLWKKCLMKHQLREIRDHLVSMKRYADSPDMEELKREIELEETDFDNEVFNCGRFTSIRKKIVLVYEKCIQSDHSFGNLILERMRRIIKIVDAMRLKCPDIFTPPPFIRLLPDNNDYHRLLMIRAKNYWPKGNMEYVKVHWDELLHADEADMAQIYRQIDANNIHISPTIIRQARSYGRDPLSFYRMSNAPEND